MHKFTTEEFNTIYKIIINSGFLEGLQESGTLMEALSSLWDLYVKGAIDKRFKTLYEDIEQHWVNNRDYDSNKLFVEYLGLLSEKSKYEPFILLSVNPSYVTNETIRKNILNNINNELKGYNVELTPIVLPDGKINYRYSASITGMDTSEIVRNQIPIKVIKSPTGYSHRWRSHPTPTEFPILLLVSDDGWADGCVHTQFNLFYYESETKRESFGLVKLIKKNSDMPCDENSEYRVKNDGLPDEFTMLTSDFCTLGQDENYYRGIKSRFSDNGMSIFLALRDVAVFPQINDEFYGSKYYCSLTREDKAERLLREAKLIIDGVDVDSRYAFSYHFCPKIADNEVEFEFNFRNITYSLAKRMYAVIGKNGVGKTQFITTLPRDLSDVSNEKFTPHKPILSKVISLSFSSFDKFKPATNNTRLNYYHYGLVKLDENGVVPKTDQDLSEEVMNAYENIILYNRTEHLKKVLSSVLRLDIIDRLFDGDRLKRDAIGEMLNKLSSGERMLYYMFCILEAEMRYDTLILLDEPETHMHPNAISQLICALDNMLLKYNSCCIMVTHSPLFVRELTSDCVYVMELEDRVSSVRHPGIETLGTNLSTIIDDIFGTSEVVPNYKRHIAEVVRGKNYEDIISDIAPNGQLGLGIDLYIRSLCSQNER